MTDLKIFQDGSHEIEDNYTEKHTKSLKSIRPHSRNSIRQENTNEYSSILDTSSIHKTAKRLQSSKLPREAENLDQTYSSIQENHNSKIENQSIKNLKKMITLKKLGAPSTSYTKKRKELNPLTCKSSLSVRSHQNSIENHAVTQKNSNNNTLLRAFYSHQC